MLLILKEEPLPSPKGPASSNAPSEADNEAQVEEDANVKRFLALHKAYTKLTDPEWKKEYDQRGIDTEYYDVLGIPKGASIKEVKTAFKALVINVHPDKAESRRATAAASTASASKGAPKRKSSSKPPAVPKLNVPHGTSQFSMTSDENQASPSGYSSHRGQDSSSEFSTGDWMKDGERWKHGKRQSPRASQDAMKEVLKRLDRQ